MQTTTTARFTVDARGMRKLIHQLVDERQYEKAVVFLQAMGTPLHKAVYAVRRRDKNFDYRAFLAAEGERLEVEQLNREPVVTSSVLDIFRKCVIPTTAARRKDGAS